MGIIGCPESWQKTVNLQLVTFQKSEGLYFAIVHSMVCLANFCRPVSGKYRPAETSYWTVGWIKRTQSRPQKSDHFGDLRVGGRTVLK
jgi:hypothetical protein